MAKVQRALPLGKWGVIENVQMNPAGGKYRTTRHPYKMAISDETVIRGSDLADDRIFLSLSNYESIGKTEKKRLFTLYVLYVIERVHDLGDVLTVKAQGEDKKRVEFRLVDSQGNNLPCCLWGTYTEQIEAFIEKCDDRTFVCLIRFAKVTFLRGEVQITNAFDASHMYLNPTEPDVLELTESLSAAHSQLATVEKSTGKKDDPNNNHFLTTAILLPNLWKARGLPLNVIANKSKSESPIDEFDLLSLPPSHRSPRSPIFL
ncbi:hypothetical protein F2Q68_00032194 [Brassica cretica]|uniref:DUF223 domain-containing protein n=1 Tax=Brassica cretica TaxID=69181 RepID=A0A8S9GCC2_BRACR|nr:hypothetical protein F2Q68_00032194 [Brassica cretica]